MKQFESLEKIRCDASGPFVNMFDAEMNQGEVYCPMSVGTIKPAVEHIKSLVPPRVGLNVLMCFTTNTGGMYPSWGTTDETLCSIAGMNLASVSTIDFLYENGAQLDWRPIADFELSSHWTKCSMLYSLLGAAKGSPPDLFESRVAPFDYLLNHPSCNWNILHDEILITALLSKNARLWEIIIGGDSATHVRALKLSPQQLATSFENYGIHNCNLLSKLVNTYDAPLPMLKWLMQPRIGRDLFGIDTQTCSVFHVMAEYAAFKPEILEFLKNEAKAAPNLNNHQGFSTVEFLLSATCATPALNKLVASYGVSAFLRPVPLQEEYWRVVRARELFSTHFVEPGNPYMLTPDSMLAVSSLSTIDAFLAVALEKFGPSSDRRRESSVLRMHREGMLHVLRNGYLHPSSDNKGELSRRLEKVLKSVTDSLAPEPWEQEMRVLAKSLFVE